MKKGFTLAEVLISVAVIGFIMAMSIKTINIVRASYTSLAYFANENIRSMVRILMMGKQGSFSIDNDATMYCYTKNPNGGIKKHLVFKPDIEPEEKYEIPECRKLGEIEGETIGIFCSNLVNVSNTTGNYHCSAGVGGMNSDFFDTEIDTTTGEPYISSLEPNSPNFIAANGQRYYISKRAFTNAISSDFGYRLVAVDLNGSARPNVSMGTNPPPDIVTFMIFDNGEIYPIGVAADNIVVSISDNKTLQYITSRVKGFNFGCDDPEGNCSVYIPNTTRDNTNQKTTYTYREAFCSVRGTQDIVYENYCAGILPHELCPYSSDDRAFDLCQHENIRPMFRFNFK